MVVFVLFCDFVTSYVWQNDVNAKAALLSHEQQKTSKYYIADQEKKQSHHKDRTIYEDLYAKYQTSS